MTRSPGSDQTRPTDTDWDSETGFLQSFAALLGENAALIFDQIAAQSEAPQGSTQEAAEYFVEQAFIDAFRSPGGLARLASDAPLPPPEDIGPHDAYFASADDFLHLVLFSLREQIFIHFGGDTESCRQLNDLVHAVILGFRRQLRDWLLQAPSENAVIDRDPITGLPGPHSILDALTRLIEERKESRKTIAVMLIDPVFALIDQDPMRPIREVARRLCGAISSVDIVGRFDVKTFVVVLTEIPGAEVSVLAAAKIQRALGVTPIAGDRVTSFTGAAIFPDHSLHAAGLLTFAAAARDAARLGNEAFRLHDPASDLAEQQRRQIETKFIVALENNQFEMFYQPKADLRHGTIFGAEALLRWNPIGGEIKVAKIVEIARSCGRAQLLSRWVINACLRQLSAFLAAKVEIELSINITAADLLDGEFPEFVSQALATWKVPSSNVQLELTEESMINDDWRSMESLRQLKLLGLKISIDDFGTGYSSLAYLRRMPINELKIDQSFVRNMRQIREDAQIVGTIIDLARHFDLTVVAEGVEDWATARRLRELGCDLIQGYLLSKPMKFDHFVSWWNACEGRVQMSR